MEAHEQLRSWSGQSLGLVVQHAALPLRTYYVGLLRKAGDQHMMFHVDSKIEGGKIVGGPGIDLIIALDKADVRFSAHSTVEQPVVKVTLKGAELTSARDDFIEIGPTLRYG